MELGAPTWLNSCFSLCKSIVSVQRLNLIKSRATANVPAKIAMSHDYHFLRSSDQMC